MTGHAIPSRYDIYRLIHKALRAFMAETLVAAGAMDTDDDADVAATLARVRELLALCRKHLEHENEGVHPAMEAREPGSTRHAAEDHADHAHWFERLEAGIDAVEGSRGSRRADAAHALYRGLAVFVGENFVHMNIEETENNAVLWRTHSDDELKAIEQAIVESQPPEDKALTARWIATAATPAERAGFLGEVRGVVPAEAFQGLLGMIQPLLRPTDREKLERALSTAELAA